MEWNVDKIRLLLSLISHGLNILFKLNIVILILQSMKRYHFYHVHPQVCMCLVFDKYLDKRNSIHH